MCYFSTMHIVPKEYTRRLSLVDPRYFFVLFFSLFLFHVLSTPAFARSLDDFLFTASFFIALDLIFKFFLNQKLSILSAFVSAFGFFVIIDSNYWWVGALGALLTIGSKHFIKLNNRHIFNPNNFAIVILSLSLPEHLAPFGGMRWGGDIMWSLIISFLGLILCFLAGRAFLACTFILSFSLIAFLRSYFFDVHLFLTLSVLMTPGILIFVYFMITDPRTSPNSVKLQIVFAVGIALIDQLLRLFQFRLSFFLALFIMTAVYTIADTLLKDKEDQPYWGTANLHKARK